MKRTADRIFIGAVHCMQAGDLAAADRICHEVLDADPDHIDALTMAGIIAAQTGSLDTSISYLRKAIELDPDNPYLHGNLAKALVANGDVEAAVKHLELALEKAPRDGYVSYDLGCAYLKMNRFSEAGAAFRRSISLMPDYVAAYNNLGDALHGNGDLENALACYESALVLNPDLVEAMVNKGLVLQELGRLDESLACYAKALAITPDDPDIYLNRSMCYLVGGDFRAGWEDYEWRWKKRNKLQRNIMIPAWDGTLLDGKTILVYAEQGIGDEVMFASCIPDLQDRAGQVLIECERRLEPLFSRSFPGTRVFGAAQNEPLDWINGKGLLDFSVASGSLPRYLRPDLESFPVHNGYLRADPGQVSRFSGYLDGLGDRFKIGISWRGGGDAFNQLMRSVPLEEWLPMFHTTGVELVNIQYGDHDAEIEAFQNQYGTRLNNIPDVDPLRDMDGFAALISALDLVISVDNSTLHLAGALGVPAWGLISYVPNWRWLQNSETAYWYPSVHLYRRSAGQSWGSVMQQVTTAVQEVTCRKNA